MTTATETAAPEAATAWQAQIIEQLGHADTDNATHAIITRDEEGAQLVDVAESENAAVIVAEDWTAKRPEEEFTIVKLDELTAWAERDDSFAEHPAGVEETAPVTPDPDTGQLFQVPKVTIDTTQPTLLNLAFAGGITVGDRDEKAWVEFYNSLRAGKTAELKVTVHVAGAKKTHRRDKEGDVDAVVETKSLIITDVTLEGN